MSMNEFCMICFVSYGFGNGKIVYLEGLFEKLSISLIDNKGIW